MIDKLNFEQFYWWLLGYLELGREVGPIKEMLEKVKHDEH